MLVLLPICLWVARVSSSAAAVEENREQIDVLQRLRQALADPDYRRLLIRQFNIRKGSRMNKI